jgi:hypothetical protein
MGNDRGIRLAAPGSPDYLASTIGQSRRGQPDHRTRPRLNSGAALEVTRRAVRLPETEPRADDEAMVTEINDLFRRKLADLRRLPRHERPHALRAIRDWRRLALKALRETRATNRHARHLLRRVQTPAPC